MYVSVGLAYVITQNKYGNYTTNIIISACSSIFSGTVIVNFLQCHICTCFAKI
jgi:hypothetical protein